MKSREQGFHMVVDLIHHPPKSKSREEKVERVDLERLIQDVLHIG